MKLSAILLLGLTTAFASRIKQDSVGSLPGNAEASTSNYADFTSDDESYAHSSDDGDSDDDTLEYIRSYRAADDDIHMDKLLEALIEWDGVAYAINIHYTMGEALADEYSLWGRRGLLNRQTEHLLVNLDPENGHGTRQALHAAWDTAVLEMQMRPRESWGLTALAFETAFYKALEFNLSTKLELRLAIRATRNFISITGVDYDSDIWIPRKLASLFCKGSNVAVSTSNRLCETCKLEDAEHRSQIGAEKQERLKKELKKLVIEARSAITIGNAILRRLKNATQSLLRSSDDLKVPSIRYLMICANAVGDQEVLSQLEDRESTMLSILENDRMQDLAVSRAKIAALLTPAGPRKSRKTLN